MASSLREAVLAKLVRARAVLEDLGRQGASGMDVLEWQKGYVKALEEILDLEGLSLRRYRRRPASIPAEIARISPETGAPGPRSAGTITDLSMGGCGLATALALSVGETVRVSFRLPQSPTPVTLEGAVRRAQRVGEETRAGVQFKALPERVGREFQTFLAVPEAAETR